MSPPRGRLRERVADRLESVEVDHLEAATRVQPAVCRAHDQEAGPWDDLHPEPRRCSLQRDSLGARRRRVDVDERLGRQVHDREQAQVRASAGRHQLDLDEEARAVTLHRAMELEVIRRCEHAQVDDGLRHAGHEVDAPQERVLQQRDVGEAARDDVDVLRVAVRPEVEGLEARAVAPHALDRAAQRVDQPRVRAEAAHGGPAVGGGHQTARGGLAPAHAHELAALPVVGRGDQ